MKKTSVGKDEGESSERPDMLSATSQALESFYSVQQERLLFVACLFCLHRSFLRNSFSPCRISWSVLLRLKSLPFNAIKTLVISFVLTGRLQARERRRRDHSTSFSSAVRSLLILKQPSQSSQTSLHSTHRCSSNQQIKKINHFLMARQLL